MAPVFSESFVSITVRSGSVWQVAGGSSLRVTFDDHSWPGNKVVAVIVVGVRSCWLSFEPPNTLEKIEPVLRRIKVAAEAMRAAWNNPLWRGMPLCRRRRQVYKA